MVKVSIQSDLHLEFIKHKPDIERLADQLEPADVLILAGDCCTYATTCLLVDFMLRARDKFKHILFVPGNHEYYGSPDFNVADDHLRDALSVVDNCIMLQGEGVELLGVNFAGATMWTSFEQCDPAVMFNAEKMMSDFRVIGIVDEVSGRTRTLAAHDIARVHRQHRAFIERAAVANKSNVLIVHHSPSWEAEVVSKFSGSNLSPMFHERDVWIDDYQLVVYGHTHESLDYISCRGPRVVSNQLGYPRESERDGLINVIVEVNA